MNYHWTIRLTQDKTLIHIENKRDGELLFDATLRLTRKELTEKEMSQLLKRFPAMTWTIFKGIYYQALKLQRLVINTFKYCPRHCWESL